MIIFKKAKDLRNHLEEQQKKGIAVGFVPTMGALHAGHISLIEEAKKGSGLVVCSIFVNPTQFNDPKDFQKYPVTTEKDIELLVHSGCDILFLPPLEEIYEPGVEANETFDLGYLEEIFEGKFRPGHFQGVCLVVSRLLKIVRPQHLYLGQKDYQQCMVIKRLLQLMKIEKETELVICPTLREPDGLAMSSRNMRLNSDQRNKASAIFQCLQFINENITAGNIIGLEKQATAMLEEKGFKVDYTSLANAADLRKLDQWDGKQKVVALIAAFLDEVRLIDNLVIV